MADGVLDEVGEELREQLAIAGDLRALGDGNRADEPIARLLGDGLVDVGDVGQHGAELDAAEARAARAGLDLRDAQKRLERLDDGIQLSERLLHLRTERRPIVGVAQRQLEAAAQPADRLLQVVSDVGRRLIDALDQLLQMRQRGVDLRRDVIEIVVRCVTGTRSEISPRLTFDSVVANTSIFCCARRAR